MITSGLWRARGQKVEKVHQWRPRRSRFGELVQWDTSEHEWLEGRGEKLYLIAMVDDATSRLCARFVRHDSTEENMKLLWSYLEKYGRPVAFYTDKASLFQTAEKRKRDEPGVEKDPVEMPPTQIGRALRELDITWIAAHSPQAKGRVERNFATAQDRLVKGMRVAGVKTIEEANRYLAEDYLVWWERELTVEPASADDAHRPLGRRPVPDRASRRGQRDAWSIRAGRESPGRFHGGALWRTLPEDGVVPRSGQNGRYQQGSGAPSTTCVEAEAEIELEPQLRSEEGAENLAGNRMTATLGEWREGKVRPLQGNAPHDRPVSRDILSPWSICDDPLHTTRFPQLHKLPEPSAGVFKAGRNLSVRCDFRNQPRTGPEPPHADLGPDRVKERAGRITLFSSSTMSSGRLFLDQV